MRRPAAAGKFYPGTEDALRREVENLLSEAETGRGFAAVSPHAGYRFSGRLAARSLSALGSHDTFVMVGPNHVGLGEPVAASADTWRTPLGDVEVDRELLEEVDVPVDESAHAREHSLEVQLPFLQALHNDFSIVPISMQDQGREAAKRVADELNGLSKEFGLVASSDLTHYEPLGAAERRDRAFLARVTDLDFDGIYEEAARGSICGYGPVAVATELSKTRGAEPKKLGYSTSAEATGDESSVVGYGSIIFT